MAVNPGHERDAGRLRPAHNSPVRLPSDATLADLQHDLRDAYAGGMLIFPVGVLLTKALGYRGQHAYGNPLGTLALETTVWLVLSMPIAYVVSLYRVDLFFPAMLLVIGGRYATFVTMYSRRVFWICGGALVAAAYALAMLRAAPATGAFTGAAIEAAFAAWIVATHRRAGDAGAPPVRTR